ncbi:MAG: RluA family pseudouridine synthase [Rhabdochlamydiaceae bacterium]
MKEHKLIVNSSDKTKLLLFLKAIFDKQYSVKELKKVIDHHGCRVNNQIECVSTREVQKGDVVNFDPRVLPLRQPSFLPQVLCEDEFMTIYNKNAGFVCDDDEWRKSLDIKNLHLVNRLDKDTSGVVITAKNVKVKEEMIALFRQHKIRKGYLCIVQKSLNEKAGKIDKSIYKKKSLDGKTIYTTQQTSFKGESALTFWRLIKKTDKASYLLCEPITGRTHQIRVHMSHLDAPIWGDYLYGARYDASFSCSRYLLHSYLLSFVNPFTHKNIEVKAPIPQDFLTAINALNLGKSLSN